MPTYYHNPCHCGAASDHMLRLLLFCSLLLHLCVAAFFMLREDKPAGGGDLTVEIGQMGAMGQPGLPQAQEAVPVPAAVQPVPTPQPVQPVTAPVRSGSPRGSSRFSFVPGSGQGSGGGVGNSSQSHPLATPLPFPEVQRRINTDARYRSYSGSR